MSTPTTPGDQLRLTIDDLFRLLPEIAEAMDAKHAAGIEQGLTMALGRDRAAAVMASLRGDDPGTRVARQVRSRDLQAARRNLALMRAG